MSKGLINIFLFIAACIALFYISQNLIAEKKVPSFGDAFSTSTPGLASSTEQIASTTTYIINALMATSSDDLSVVTSLFPQLKTTNLVASKGSVKAFIADTEETRQQGLSDIKSLPNDSGMLFVFNNPGKYGFWMKDMNFPLDLIWIDGNRTIAGVTKNVLPSSYPFVFMPPREISYVLEMDAGSVASFGLTTGTKVQFSLP